MTNKAIKLAVALKYQKPHAPQVTAIGRGDFARRIIELAETSGVPISQNAGLAMALSEVEIDEEIPENLYRAVAEVLSYILRVSGKLNGLGPQRFR
jgi:flagellar biosynthesis protein